MSLGRVAVSRCVISRTPNSGSHSSSAEIPAFFIILFWATLFSLPYVGIGLILLGLPVTLLLHRYLLKPWFGLVAAAWGGVAGSIIYYWYNYIHYGGSNELAELTGIQESGPVYGIPTGLAWAALPASSPQTRGY